MERGQAVANFGDAASSLLADTLDAFDAATQSSACAIGPRRKDRREELEKLITADLRSLFSLQLADLQKQSLKRFEARLLQLLSGVKDAAALPDEAGEREVRKFALAFATSAARLVVPGVAGSPGAREETEAFSEALAATRNDFDESAPAKVLRLNRLERKVQRSRKLPKNPRSIVPGLHLTGMLRQVGAGNLQGFAGYTLGPHSVTMG